MKFILVWFIVTGVGPATSSAEFNSVEDCNIALVKLVKDTMVSRAVCLAKGHEK